MITLFISDLHLDECRDDITQAFLRFLNERAPQAQALYILGDLFEVWIGDDGMSPYQRQIAQALRQLADQGTQIFLMHGNRDFMLGKGFCREAGCQLIREQTLINLYGQSALLMHGDLLCIQDREYLRKRWRLRNPISRWLLRHLPLSTRHQLARKLRVASQYHTRNQPQKITDVTPEAVQSYMARYAVQVLIHGHTHRPTIEPLKVLGQPAHRIVLGDWDRQAWVLEVTERHQYRLKAFPL